MPGRLIIFLICSFSASLWAQADSIFTYKVVGEDSLSLHLYQPPSFHPDSSYPALVFFFGGGWNQGTAGHLAPQARYLADRGMITICVDYRTKKHHGTSPFDALADAKSAMRFVRAHASQLSIDPTRIGAGGGSAGGHLAAACALISDFNDPQDNIEISPEPALLVLYNPVIDNGPGGYGYERVKDKYQSFSPIHNLREAAPPTIFFLGTADKLIPVETGQYYAKIMERTGGRCDLHLYEGAGHGFFNPGRTPDHHENTLQKTAAFLRSVGWLEGE